MKGMEDKVERRGKMFAGVAGKTVRFIESSLGEDDQPHICIQFDDGTEIDIKVESKPDVAVEWYRVKDGNHSPLRHKAFL
jgi:hypothetical protein